VRRGEGNGDRVCSAIRGGASDCRVERVSRAGPSGDEHDALVPRGDLVLLMNAMPMRRSLAALLASLAIAGGMGIGLVAANLGTPGASPSASLPLVAGPSPQPIPSGSPGPAGPSATPAPSSSAAPPPSPEPTPTTVAAPLTGRLVEPDVARRHPIAVMIDDLSPARPQSGFNAASVVFQAPAEGGIPRYMLVFQDRVPKSVGPVRSARYYYIAWAAQWRAMFVHVGGSPQAMQTLAAQGQGQLVYNADEFRWGAKYLWRVRERLAPHNVYSDGKRLRQLLKRVGAQDVEMPMAWRFRSDKPLTQRPVGGRIEFGYPANHIRYDYERKTNTYKRSVTREGPQIDAADGRRVAPKNVVIMLVSFAPLNDGHPEKHRLEANVLGSGQAWIATNGKTIKGTWRKASLTGPLRFFDSKGEPLKLTIGQTFVQVLRTGSVVTVKDGKVPKAKPKPAPVVTSRPGVAPRAI
jgi:hypothetical protein